MSEFRVSEKRLTAIATDRNSIQLTIGDYDGKIYLLNFTEAFTAIDKIELRIQKVRVLKNIVKEMKM